MTLDLKPAFEIALHVHGGQRDKGGDEYMWHVCRVGMAGTTPEEQVVGLLHDTLEDVPPTLTRLRVDGAIHLAYGEAVQDAVWALTRQDDEPYLEYLKRLSANPLAVQVKLHDLMDNMRADRLLKLPPEDRVRLLKKYQDAYEFLRKVGQ